MTDQELWNAALRQIRQAWAALSPDSVERFTGLARQAAERKEALHALAATAGAAARCVSCRGACCYGGKHHVTTIDICIHLALDVDLFTPSFTAPVCPHAGYDGCLMAPAVRPRTCVMFLCDEVLAGMESSVAAALAGLESELARLYREMGALLGVTPARSLILAAESSLVSGIALVPAAN